MTEFGLIDRIRDLTAALPSNGFEGIGDDCAVLPLGNGESLVFTSDLLVEEVHFLRRATSARELGGKALAVNLSDVAAMGARPVATLLSLALPPETMEGWAEAFAEGYRDLAARYGVALVGWSSPSRRSAACATTGSNAAATPAPAIRFSSAERWANRPQGCGTCSMAAAARRWPPYTAIPCPRSRRAAGWEHAPRCVP